MSYSKFFLFCCVIFSNISAVDAQITGELAESSRPVVDSISFEMEYKKEGVLVYDIVVDRDGVVTQCIWNRVASTISSRQMSYMAKNHILTGLRFSEDNTYPPLQYGKVTINLVVPAE
jgi:hypothetical protein